METRREFLKSTLTLAACVVRASALGKEGAVPPSERVRMGLIGCGIHGAGWNTDLMFANDEQQITAICDVDSNHLATEEAKVNRFYSQKFGCDYRVRTFGDFRELLRSSEVDAVDIVTPDHWHVLMTVAALRAGKDVICEKPTLTVRQGEILCAEVEKSGRVYLTASENRTVDQYQQIVNVIRNGLIGELRHIKVLLPPGNADRLHLPLEERPVPEGLNYDLWLGPAPVRPYVPGRLHNQWRWNLDYSGGSLTDWASHNVNLAQWANRSDDTSPVEMTGPVGAFPAFDSVWNTTPTFRANFRYANGVTMEVFSEVPGIKFEGSAGWIMIRGYRGETTASDARLLSWRPGPADEDVARDLKYCTVGRSGKTALGNLLGGEHRHFARCVKERCRETYYTAAMSRRNHTISHSMNIGMWLNREENDPTFKLCWDPKIEKFIGEHSAEAMATPFYDRPQREGYTFADVDGWF